MYHSNARVHTHQLQVRAPRSRATKRGPEHGIGAEVDEPAGSHPMGRFRTTNPRPRILRSLVIDPGSQVSLQAIRLPRSDRHNQAESKKLSTSETHSLHHLCPSQPWGTSCLPAGSVPIILQRRLRVLRNTGTTLNSHKSEHHHSPKGRNARGGFHNPFTLPCADRVWARSVGCPEIAARLSLALARVGRPARRAAGLAAGAGCLPCQKSTRVPTLPAAVPLAVRAPLVPHPTNRQPQRQEAGPPRPQRSLGHAQPPAASHARLPRRHPCHLASGQCPTLPSRRQPSTPATSTHPPSVPTRAQSLSTCRRPMPTMRSEGARPPFPGPQTLGASPPQPGRR